MARLLWAGSWGLHSPPSTATEIWGPLLVTWDLGAAEVAGGLKVEGSTQDMPLLSPVQPGPLSWPWAAWDRAGGGFILGQGVRRKGIHLILT